MTCCVCSLFHVLVHVGKGCGDGLVPIFSKCVRNEKLCWLCLGDFSPMGLGIVPFQVYVCCVYCVFNIVWLFRRRSSLVVGHYGL